MLSYLQSFIKPEPDSYVKQIFIHPVKGLRGIELQECEVDEFGFKYDRQYMVCEPDKKGEGPLDYRFVTQREVPQLTLIVTEIDQANNELVLRYPPKDAELRLPLDISEAVLQNAPRVNAWIWDETPESIDLSKHYPDIGQFFDLVRGTEHGKTIIVAADKRRMVQKGIPGGAVERGDLTNSSFQDYFPGNLINQQSLEDLRARVEKKTDGTVVLEARNFRPNLVIDNTAGAWDEDEWLRVKVGEKSWYVPCRNVRCRVTTVNLEQGKFEPSNEPLKEMMSFRRIDPGAKYGPCFGMNLVNDQTGFTVKVGDPVKVLERTKNHHYPGK